MSAERPQPSARGRFAHFRPVQLRWNDNDPYGHVNNAVHFQLFDSAVNDWMIEAGLMARDLTGAVYLVAGTSCDYFDEVSYPERPEIALGIERLGGASVRYRLALFREGADLSAAEGIFTHVHVHPETRRPLPIPEAHRAAFTPLLIS